MSRQNIFNVFTFFSLIVLNSEVKAAFSTASVARVGRIQPIRLFASGKPVNTPNVHTRSGSVSSVSSFSTLASETSFTQPKPIQTEPILSRASDFNGVELQPISEGELRPISESGYRPMSESELQPMIERARHVSFMETVDLHDASAATHSNGNINPARDGVFARVRSATLRFGIAAVVGTSIGAGGAVIARNYFHKTIETTSNVTMESSDEEILRI